MINARCPVCEGNNILFLTDYRGIHKAFLGMKLVQCRECDMNFSFPLPTESDLIAYNASYFERAHGGITNNLVANSFFSGMARLRAEHLRRYLVKYNISEFSLLEIGPGPGFFARNWLEEYPTTSYMAVESDSSCHTILDEIGVVVVDSLNKLHKNDAFNIVIMSHVLEHVSDPANFIMSHTANLIKGGVMFIEVPCRDWEHKLVDEPHLLFFDKGPLFRLLDKLGFEDIELAYFGREIVSLRRDSITRRKLMAIRSKIISIGIIKPFASVRIGMESLNNPLERAAVAPFKAHCETDKPAWWLRAVARKK